MTGCLIRIGSGVCNHLFKPLRTGNHKSGTVANSEEPDEMPHHGLHCLLKQNRERNTIYVLEIITCNPSIYTMNHPMLNVSNFIKIPLVVRPEFFIYSFTGKLFQM